MPQINHSMTFWCLISLLDPETSLKYGIGFVV